MKAAVLKEIGKPFAIADVPAPQIGPDEVLIETRTCGICRTDLHIQDGLAYVPQLPHVPGHEPAGVVAAAYFCVAFAIELRLEGEWVDVGMIGLRGGLNALASAALVSTLLPLFESMSGILKCAASANRSPPA